jgi:hypothetical protein
MQHTDLPRSLRIRRGFLIAAAALAGILAFAAMAVDPVPDGSEGYDFIVGYANDLNASGLHTNLLHYGYALWAPVAFAAVGLVRHRGAALANAAGLLAILGLTTLPGLVMTDFWAVATLRATDVETLAAMERELENLHWFSALIAPVFVAALAALPLAVVALWRAGLVPWGAPLAAIIAMAAPNFDFTWWIVWGVHAAGMIAVAVFLARIPVDQWYPAVRTQAAARRDEATV